MAKINKKIVKKVTKKRILIKKSTKIETKECFVNLVRMSQKEIGSYRNSKEIITKTFDLQISGGILRFGDKKQNSTNNTFTIKLKKKLSEITLELCEQTSGPGKSQALPIVNPRSLGSIITSAWNKCKKEFKSSNQSLEAGSIVMAKMATFSPWPARITDFMKTGKRVTVYFYGDHTSGSINVNEIVPFVECSEVVKLLLLRKTGPFHKAVLEIETLLEIPPELSMLKEVGALQ